MKCSLPALRRSVTGAAGALLIALVAAQAQAASPSPLEDEIRTRSAAVESQLIAWRRDIHEHPELGNQEKRTAKLVADHLRKLGLEVRTGVARTGVVGVLRGGLPGRTVALRADMDALPVTEPAGLPFASKAKGLYQGKETGVMHACGHDAHTAMLMATAQVLAGTVVFIFQPAEEGPSDFVPATDKDTWGARMMLQEGIFDEFKPEAVLGLHVMPGRPGEIKWRNGATTASSDNLAITVTGKQGHGGMPWNTIDPIATSGVLIAGLQTVVSRRTNLTVSPAVVTIGSIHGGSAPNIVPEAVELTGTIRTYDEKVRAQVGRDVKLTAEKIAESTGATAKVTLVPIYGTTFNNDALAAQLAPALKRATDGQVGTLDLLGASEDFSYYAAKVPGLFVLLGVTPPDQDPATAAPNHNPKFMVYEPALIVGTRAMATMVVDFLDSPAK